MLLHYAQAGVEAPPEEEKVDADLGGDGDLSFAAMFAAQVALGPEDEQVEAPKPSQSSSDISPWPSAVFSVPQPVSLPEPNLSEVRKLSARCVVVCNNSTTEGAQCLMPHDIIQSLTSCPVLL